MKRPFRPALAIVLWAAASAAFAIDPPTVTLDAAFDKDAPSWTWRVTVGGDGAGGISSFHVLGLDAGKDYGFDKPKTHEGPPDFVNFHYKDVLGEGDPSWRTDWDQKGNVNGSFEFLLGSDQFTGKEQLRIVFDFISEDPNGKRETTYFKLENGKNVIVPLGAIPEPSAALLLLAGLGVLGWRCRQPAADAS